MKKKIVDLFTQSSGKALKKSNQIGTLHKYITTSNLFWGHFDFSEVREMYFSDTEVEKCTAKKGDLLVCNGGDVGRAAVWNYDYDICLQNHVTRLRKICDNLNPFYYYYFFKFVKQNNLIEGNGVGIESLSAKEILNIEVPFPSQNEQNQIVKKLDSIQSAIDNKKKQLALLDEAVKSEFAEMFGELDLSPQRTDWTELKNITTIFTGTTPSTTDEENWNGDVLWITPAEMTSDSFYIYDTERKITSKGQKSKSLSLMPVNTVLLSTRAPIGKVGIAGTQMTCNQGFKNFYCKEDVLNPVYLYFLFKSNTDYLNSKGTGTTFKELSKSVAEKIKVPVPSLELQKQFAAFVQQIDKSKFVVKQQIPDLQELLDSKMQEYFGE